MNQIKYYHGTSSNAPVKDTILPPNVHSFGISELGRSKNLDKVFVTTNRGYASTYARRVANMKGCEPVIYEVLCDNVVLYQTCNGLDIYTTNEAHTTGVVYCGKVRNYNTILSI